MRIAISGSHGFVGSHLFDALRKEGRHQVKRFDRALHSLERMESLRSLVARQDLIFHLAGANRASPQELIRVNTLGSLNLLEAIKKYGQENVGLIFLSSFQVYKPAEGKVLADETWPAEPQTIYGISKRTAEELIINSGVKSIIFRASNIFGPGSRPFYNSVIPTFIHLIIKGEPLPINGTGQQARDFIYIADIIDGLQRTITHNWEGVKLFNLCSGRPVSVSGLIKGLKKISQADIAIRNLPALAEKGCLVGDNRRARKELGWAPKFTFLEGLKETYQWFRNSR